MLFFFSCGKAERPLKSKGNSRKEVPFFFLVFCHPSDRISTKAFGSDEEVDFTNHTSDLYLCCLLCVLLGFLTHSHRGDLLALCLPYNPMVDLNLTILPHPLKRWDFRHVPPQLAQFKYQLMLINFINLFGELTGLSFYFLL